MGAIYKHEGRRIKYTPGADVSSEDIVVLGDLVGVATHDIKSGELGELQVEGVFLCTCKDTDDIGQGDNLWYDSGNDELTLTATANTYFGTATEAAGVGVTTVRAKLQPNGNPPTS